MNVSARLVINSPIKRRKEDLQTRVRTPTELPAGPLGQVVKANLLGMSSPTPAAFRGLIGPLLAQLLRRVGQHEWTKQDTASVQNVCGVRYKRFRN